MGDSETQTKPTMARKPPVVHGAVLIDKPAGMTSHDAVVAATKTVW